MRAGFPYIIAIGLYVLAASAATAAQGNPEQKRLACQDFQRNSDNSWTPKHQVVLNGVTFDSGISFFPGTTFAGADWGALLDRQCK
jgi:hypothetical protein